MLSGDADRPEIRSCIRRTFGTMTLHFKNESTIKLAAGTNRGI